MVCLSLDWCPYYLCLPATKELRDELQAIKYFWMKTLGLCQHPFFSITWEPKPLAKATASPTFLTSWPAGPGVRGSPNLMAHTSQYERRSGASGVPEVGFTKRKSSCGSDAVFAMYVLSAATGHNVLSKAGNWISGGRGFLMDWIVRMNPGEVRSIASESVRILPA